MTMNVADVQVGMDRHYGVHVTYLGEDGEGMLAFTADRRRALAAMSKQVRVDGDRLAEMYDVAGLRVEWMVFRDTCGCEHAVPGECRADLNGPVTCCTPDEDDDSDPAQDIIDHDCAFQGLPPCGDEYSWVGDTDGVTAATPGAVQVCRVRQ